MYVIINRHKKCKKYIFQDDLLKLLGLLID